MAVRKPLVLNDVGIVSEIPSGDVIEAPATGLVHLTASATNEVSTSSTTPSIISGMTFTTPQAGTYLAIFSGNCYVERNASNSYGHYQIYVGGSPQSNSLRDAQLVVNLLLGVIGTTRLNCSGGAIIVPVELNGSQNVDVRFWSDTTATTTYCSSRCFTLLRIS